ncbi:MAG: acyltransferase [Terriglobia bacterium]
MDYFVHPSSFVDDGAEIGSGTKIWHFCHIMPRVRIGRCCNIGQNVFIASEVLIGTNVKIQNNVSIYTGVVIEDDVFLGPSMVFTNVINPRSHVPRRGEYQTTQVKQGASIGANATIVCGVTLGRYCFVGAGALVSRNVPDFALVYGNPAKIRGWMCQCGIKLPLSVGVGDAEAVCESCKTAYVKRAMGVRRQAEARSERPDAGRGGA